MNKTASEAAALVRALVADEHPLPGQARALAPPAVGRFPPSGRRPFTASGSRVASLRPTIVAPIRVSGSATRPIGRRLSDSSPVSMVQNGCPASTPRSSRAVVPEFPQSTTSPGSWSPSRPTPTIR